VFYIPDDEDNLIQLSKLISYISCSTLLFQKIRKV